jgi:hypothetical protein
MTSPRLLDESGLPGAEGRADGELALSGSGASQQGLATLAGDQQDKRHRADEHESGVASPVNCSRSGTTRAVSPC